MSMENTELINAIYNLEYIMKSQGINPTKGLPEELFLFATTLMPCANIDLFIHNKNGQLLLTWRDDEFYGQGWHIPGGCIRMMETIDERIQKTALKELGVEVCCNPKMIAARESFTRKDRPWLDNQLTRAHNISLLFDCTLPDHYVVDNRELSEHDAGFLKWFDNMPEDILECHKILYGDIINKFFLEGGV